LIEHPVVAVDLAEVGIGASVSVLIAVALWLLLPRGSVLIRSQRTQNWKGERLYDMWEIRNASSLPILIQSVRVLSVADYANSKKPRPRDLGVPSNLNETWLDFDDPHLANIHSDWQDAKAPWSNVLVPPGDTLVSHIQTNTTLYIRYRRAGPFGILERRRLTIHGHV
jgi:hypothetical protein